MRLPSLLAMSLVVTSYGNSDASVSVARTSPVEFPGNVLADITLTAPADGTSQ